MKKTLLIALCLGLAACQSTQRVEIPSDTSVVDVTSTDLFDVGDVFYGRSERVDGSWSSDMTITIVRYHEPTDRYFMDNEFINSDGRTGTLRNVPITVLDDGTIIFQLGFGNRHFKPTVSGLHVAEWTWDRNGEDYIAAVQIL